MLKTGFLASAALRQKPPHRLAGVERRATGPASTPRILSCQKCLLRRRSLRLQLLKK